MHRPRGFTLIELLLVLAIGSLLVVLSSTAVSWYIRKSTEFEVLRSVDALVRHMPQLAARTGCWSHLDVTAGGQTITLSACGQVSRQADLPVGYQVVLDRQPWLLPPESNLAPSRSNEPTTLPGVAAASDPGAWASPTGGGSQASLRLMRADQTLATFPLGGRSPA